MNIPNLSRLNGLVAVGKTFLSTHRPEILLGTSWVTTLGAVIAAGRGGYKSGRMIQEIENNEQRDVEVKEMIQLTWPNYLPAAGLTAGSLGSTTALHMVHVKEKKALVTAGLAAIDEVKRQVVIMTDEETEKVLEERADENGIAQIQHGDGDIEDMYLVRDARTGRDIWSNKLRIESAVVEVNMVLANSGDVELGHFYRHAGFNQTPDDNMYGWNQKDLVQLEWTTTSRDDGRPVQEFTFRPTPATGFDSANR